MTKDPLQQAIQIAADIAEEQGVELITIELHKDKAAARHMGELLGETKFKEAVAHQHYMEYFATLSKEDQDRTYRRNSKKMWMLTWHRVERGEEATTCKYAKKYAVDAVVGGVFPLIRKWAKQLTTWKPGRARTVCWSDEIGWFVPPKEEP